MNWVYELVALSCFHSLTERSREEDTTRSGLGNKTARTCPTVCQHWAMDEALLESTTSSSWPLRVAESLNNSGAAILKLNRDNKVSCGYSAVWRRKVVRQVY